MNTSSTGISLGPSTATGAAWQMLGFICLTGCGYIVAVLLARSFGPVAFGVYGVVYSVLMASEQILRLGVPQALTKLIAGSGAADTSKLESTGMVLGLLINLAGFAGLWMIAPWLADWLKVENGTLLFRIAVLDIPFFGLYRVVVHILNGRRDFRTTGKVTCAYALTRTLGIVILVVTGSLTIEGALLVNVIASLVGLLLLLPRAGARVFQPTLIERTQIMSLALPILVSDVGIQCLLGVDLWLLSAFSTSLEAEVRGDYVAALSLARVPNILTFVLASVLVPSIARALSTGDRDGAVRLVLGTTRLLTVLLFPCGALIVVNAGELMALFFSESYRPGGRYLALLILAQGLGFTFLGALQAILIGTGDAAIAARRIYVGLGIAVALNLILIPLYGGIGAAIAAILSFAITVLLVAQVVRRRMGVLLEPRRALLALLASILIAVSGWLIPTTGPMVLLELGGLGMAYLGLGWILGLFDASDIALLRGRR
ncbi:MAG TPA: oligosaccharide flippase family protein [Steroidobacteraceae bacterium]|nr:oligosaccharide flippase family protein [Steroidobacteraceae bacterium]